MNYTRVRDLQIPAITTAQMQEVDRLAVEENGIPIIQMMENAGRNLAELVKRLLGNSMHAFTEKWELKLNPCSFMTPSLGLPILRERITDEGTG